MWLSVKPSIEERVYVPRDKLLRQEIIQEHHNSRMAGHPGWYKTQELITRNYWWPMIFRDVKSYVDGCEACQRTKVIHKLSHAPLHPHSILATLWEKILVDLVGPLPMLHGHDMIMVVVDWLTKAMVAILTISVITTNEVARLFQNNVWSQYGLPRTIIRNRGPQFVSQFMRDLLKLLGIKGNPSMAYHPQTDRQTERMNQELEQYLRIHINYQQDNWSEWLSLAEFTYNNQEHSATKKTQSAIKLAEQMQQVHEEVGEAIAHAQRLMKTQYDKQRKESQDYQPGDRAWVDGKEIATD
jgi:hypothetical protein